MKNLISRLERKGWKKSEISKAVSIIKNAKKSKPKELLFLEKKISIILLLLVIAVNFAVSISFIPLLITLKGVVLYFIIIVMGIFFGLLFEVVIRSMEHLEKQQHMVLAAIIPAIALLNFSIISKLSNKISINLGFRNSTDPFAVGIVYAGSFIAPYIFYKFVLKKDYYLK
jgi:hypothetical protein